MLFVPMAFLDLFRGALLRFSFELLRILTFAVTHFCSLLLTIDSDVPILDADAVVAWQQISQLL